MASLRLRDRDGIITEEGLIFRVFGYSHPPDAYICDAEYASDRIFTSTDPRAPRTGGDRIFYKFYDDQAWKLIFNKFPQYTLLHAMLGRKVIGITRADILETRKPGETLRVLVNALPKDELADAMQRVLITVKRCSGLAMHNFGVFGSMLYGFHHPKLSDIDLVVYGIDANRKVRATLETLYGDKQSGFGNEFESMKVMENKRWRFKNFSIKEFVWHQKRKQIYGLFEDVKNGRTIKAEFEPVKAWNEVKSEYNSNTRILRKDWVKIKARITDDSEAPFIPSIYGIEPMEVLSGSRIGLEADRVVSYMEEFRLQAWKDETVILEGNLEEVLSTAGSYHQIALTYCPRYYEQTLKVEDLRV